MDNSILVLLFPLLITVSCVQFELEESYPHGYNFGYQYISSGFGTNHQNPKPRFGIAKVKVQQNLHNYEYSVQESGPYHHKYVHQSAVTNHPSPQIPLLVIQDSEPIHHQKYLHHGVPHHNHHPRPEAAPGPISPLYGNGDRVYGHGHGVYVNAGPDHGRQIIHARPGHANGGIGHEQGSIGRQPFGVPGHVHESQILALEGPRYSQGSIGRQPFGVPGHVHGGQILTLEGPRYSQGSIGRQPFGGPGHPQGNPGPAYGNPGFPGGSVHSQRGHGPHEGQGYAHVGQNIALGVGYGGPGNPHSDPSQAYANQSPEIPIAGYSTSPYGSQNTYGHPGPGVSHGNEYGF